MRNHFLLLLIFTKILVIGSCDDKTNIFLVLISDQQDGMKTISILAVEIIAFWQEKTLRVS
jgi:hypothetical protein